MWLTDDETDGGSSAADEDKDYTYDEVCPIILADISKGGGGVLSCKLDQDV